MSGSGRDGRERQESELSKAGREAVARLALAAVALVIAVNIPVSTWAKILIFFTALFGVGIVMRVRKVRGSH